MSTKQGRLPYPLSPLSSQLGNLNPHEELIVRRFSDFSQFKDFATEPNVGPELHQQAIFSFLSNYENLHDGIFAMYGALAVSKSIDILDFDREANIKQGAVALGKFRSLPCPSTEVDFVPWLWLGTSLVIHAHCAFGSSASPLRRYLLGHLRCLGEPGTKFAAHPVVVSMAAMDIYDSLLHGHIPIMRVVTAKQSIRDPSSFFETCAPLLDLAFDLCIARFHTYDQKQENDDVQQTSRKSQEDIRIAISSWQPDFSPQMLHSLTSTETANILTQSRVHKTMLLLFIHRLHYAYGEQDELASYMANSIISDLELASAATGQPARLVITPFVVAAAEATTSFERERIRQVLPKYVYSVFPAARSWIQEWLEQCWQARDSCAGLRFTDLAKSLPSICIYL
ncbi:hypothetical protein KC320_g8023 [Hortaea werneckii]|nr:hypothetical protein KC320_g8023 [Hortaea werneckii]